MKNKFKYLITTNIIIVCIVFVLLFPCSAGAVIENATTETQITNSTEDTEFRPTVITLKKYSANIYVKNTYAIKPNVINAVGQVIFTSKNSKVATVNEQGIVTANRAGRTVITVQNNGSTARFNVTVKNPDLSQKGKAVTAIKVKRNKSVAVRIKGRIVSESHKNARAAAITTRAGNVIYIKGKKVTDKNKPATISVKVNSVKLKLKINVIAKTRFQKYVDIVYKHKKPKVTRIFNTTLRINELVVTRTNLHKLYSQKTITRAQYNSFNKISAKASYSVSDKNVLFIDKKNATVKCIGKGTSDVTVRFKDGTTFTTKITVTKPEMAMIKIPHKEWNGYTYELKYTAKKYASRVCYDYEDIYKAFKDAFYNHIIKGERPEYEYIKCAFGKTNSDKVWKRTTQKAKRDYDDGYNFYNYIIGCDWSELVLDYDVLADNKTIYIGVSSLRPFFYDDYKDLPGADSYEGNEYEYEARLKAYKRYYAIAQKIFKETHIDEFEEDYQKVTVLATWMKKNYITDTTEENDLLSLENILIHKQGVCHNWSNATNYFCTLLRIPCRTLDNGDTHLWNAIKVQGKWYQSDIYWRELLRGNDYMKTLPSHKMIGDTSYIQNSDFNDTINKIFKIKIYANDLEYTPEYFSQQYSW